jgi:hypothetical protein
MVRKKPTNRFRGRGDLFRRRIVISVPPAAAGLIAVSVSFALIVPISMGKIVTAIGLVLSLVAIGTVLEARFQLRNFRYELQEQFGEALEALVIPDGETDLRDDFESAFMGVKPDAPHRVIRLRKRSNAS